MAIRARPGIGGPLLRPRGRIEIHDMLKETDNQALLVYTKVFQTLRKMGGLRVGQEKKLG